VAAGRRAPVAGELDEVELVRDPNCAREVGDEEERALERRDQDRVESLVVRRDLGAELGDPRLDLVGREKCVPDAQGAGYLASSSRNL
jgi:hypothetical protein